MAKQCKHATCDDKCRRKEAVGKMVAKRKTIRKRSKKMVQDMRVYNRKREEFLLANPVCVVTGQPATEIHHKAGRVGKMLLDEKYWLPVSREGHLTIEYNPKWAKEMGYSVSRLNKR